MGDGRGNNGKGRKEGRKEEKQQKIDIEPVQRLGFVLCACTGCRCRYTCKGLKVFLGSKVLCGVF